MTFERVTIVTHHSNPRCARLEDELCEWLGQRRVSVVEEAPDLVIAIGGDGTVLRAAQSAHAADVPLLGINFGTLGYLTEVDSGDELGALDKVLSGSFETEDRMMLQCHDGGVYVGLNEVLVERSSPHRLVRLEVSIGGERLAAFNADGIIVATPTGSTAYALSAGGPIVDPRAECLIVVPVSPHMIFSRPFVISPDETVEITVPKGGQQAALSLDGAMGTDLAPGTRVVARRHPRPLKMVRLSGPGFLERLRTKLQLPG
jgi:NAD+ kinase